MQITPGMRVSDVCKFCFEHTIDQPCPEYDAWLESQPMTSRCKHCRRSIELVDGLWIDPEAGYDDEFGDGIWRETCDENHEDRVAAHEPEESW